MGVSGLAEWERRANFFKGVIDRFDEIKRGDAEYISRQFLKSQGVDRTAARLLLDAMGNFDLAKLANIQIPTLVLCGDKDDDNGSAEELAKLLPNARFEEVPGSHLDSATKPEMGIAIVNFLSLP